MCGTRLRAGCARLRLSYGGPPKLPQRRRREGKGDGERSWDRCGRWRPQRLSSRHFWQAAWSSIAAARPSRVRERVLLVAVGDHLERSQMVLVELANAHTRDALDISAERQSADELLASNRLYRQTAAQIGETGVADLLDDLERVLAEVANGPSQVSMQDLAAIQQRIEAQGILFKVKIIGSDMRERGNSTTTGPKQPVS